VNDVNNCPRLKANRSSGHPSSPFARYLDATRMTSRIGGTILLVEQANPVVSRNSISPNRTDYAIRCADRSAFSSMLLTSCSNRLCTIFLTISIRSRYCARAVLAISRRLVALGHEISLPIARPTSRVVWLGSWPRFLLWDSQTIVHNSERRRARPMQIGGS
jgi:hypothetical protein